MDILILKDIVRGLEDDIVGNPGGASRSWQEVVGLKLKRQAQKRASEVMSPFRVTVASGDSLVKALALMLQENVKRIPLMEGNKVIGLIRLADLLKEISGALLLKETG